MDDFNFESEAAALQSEQDNSPSEEQGQDIESYQPTADEQQTNSSPVDQQQERQQPPKSVPTAALIEERRKRQAIEQELANLRRDFEAALQPQQVPPDWANNPAEYLRYKMEGTDAKVEAIHRSLAEQQQQAAMAQQINALDLAYKNSAAEFAKHTPDFADAYNTLINSRVAELQAFGVTAPNEIRAALMNEELQIAAMALQNGQSPAEVIYGLAQSRGYRPVPRQQADAVVKGREAAKGAKTGGSGPTGLTAERLAELDGADFERGWKELFGD